MKKITDEKLAERIALLEQAEADTGQLSLHGEAELACLRELWGYRESHGALQQKLDAMAAENAAIKSVIADYAKVKQDFDDFDGDRRGIAESLCEAEDALVSGIKTPATDTYLNSVRAEGVDMVAEAIGNSAAKLKVGSKDWKALKSIVLTLVNCAAQLRSGTHDTADKAG
ncbi:MAG: hypothetical protein G3W58_22890 [Pantoea ananatis]|nr:hypothetical protein [Pantoea ananatis]